MKDIELHRDTDTHDHEMQTHFQRPDRLHEPLHVITPVFNATRFRSRWKHYQDFAKRIAEAGGELITVEAAFGRRDFAVTEPGNPMHVQVRTNSELWLKESLINRGVARLSEIRPDWTKVAWVDADVVFERDDIMDETRHTLEHHDVVQMWSRAIDMNSDNEPLDRLTYSYAACLNDNLPWPKGPEMRDDGYYYVAQLAGRKGIYWHPGYAWACTREFWDGVGGLIDFGIIGNGDRYMADALCGRVDAEPIKTPSQHFETMLLEWQRRALAVIGKGSRGGFGVVRGLITHRWHGPKAARQYQSRWKLLVDTGFDPVKHLKRDRNLIWTLDESAPTALRDGIRKIARARNEDAI